MTPAEHLRQLLTELGPALDLDGVSEFDGATWMIVRDDATSVLAELNETAGALVLSSELGTPDEECRLATYEAALIANYAAASPFAPRLALTGRNGSLQVVKPINASGLDLEHLKGAVTELFSQADRWRNIMARGGVAPEPIVFDAVAETTAFRV